MTRKSKRRKISPFMVLGKLLELSTLGIGSPWISLQPALSDLSWLNYFRCSGIFITPFQPPKPLTVEVLGQNMGSSVSSYSSNLATLLSLILVTAKVVVWLYLSPSQGQYLIVLASSPLSRALCSHLAEGRGHPFSGFYQLTAPCPIASRMLRIIAQI